MPALILLLILSDFLDKHCKSLNQIATINIGGIQGVQNTQKEELDIVYKP